MAMILRRAELIVVGKFDVDLKKTGDRVQDEDITAAVATTGLEDLAGHFFP